MLPSLLQQSHLFRRCYSAAYFFYKRHWEDPYFFLTENHPEFFSNGDILDVGANIGYTANLFASVLSPGCSVHAFEPEETNLMLLRENVTAISSSVRVVPSVVGASKGAVHLWVNPLSPSDHRVFQGPLAARVGSSAEKQSVSQTSIDAYVKEAALSKISFLKMDVQGYELPVCQGMEQTLKSHPEMVIGAEYCPEAFASLGFDNNGLENFFTTRGYQTFELTDRALLPWNPANSRPLQKRGYTDLIFKI